VTPKTTTTAVPLKDPTSGTGSGPAADRQAVVFALHRYYKAFIDGDGAAVCALLTSDGQKAMIIDGGDKTCVKSAELLIKQVSADNLKLLQATSDGLHIDDITVTGNGATAQIGKDTRLRLSQVNGKWLVRNPNVEPSKG
jgi:hypothetical protein